MKIEISWRSFIHNKPIRWLAISIIGGMVCVLAVGAAMLNPPTGSMLAEPVLSHDVAGTLFLQERLDAFSGADFGLMPDLIGFLDEMETSIGMVPPTSSSVQQLLAEYTQFVNPAAVSFDIHNLQRGENFWVIAKKRGYTIDSIVGCNPHLNNIACSIGQKIILPSRGGSFHQVQLDENLPTIALEYGVEEAEILQANFVNTEVGLMPGMWLFLPGAKPLHLTEDMYKQYAKRALFRSPLCGRYTSFVGKRIHPVLGFSKFHNGVDIACPTNTWVGASAGGVVITAGWGGAVGNYIKIDHGNGFMSMYGHLNHIYVHTGQTVKRGQLIGRAGATGRVTGPHLHFTIWKNGRVINPMEYLW